MVDPDRDLLEGVVEVDQTEIPFRAGDASFEPGSAGKILVVGAVEVIDRGAGRPKARRKGAKYLDTRSGRAATGNLLPKKIHNKTLEAPHKTGKH